MKEDQKQLKCGATEECADRLDGEKDKQENRPYSMNFKQDASSLTKLNKNGFLWTCMQKQ